MKKSPYNSVQVMALLQKRKIELETRIIRVMNELRAGAPKVAEGVESSTISNDREDLHSMYAKSNNERYAIVEAIARVDGGNYGVCLKCGDVISNQRMLAIITAFRCASCEEKAQNKLSK